jgi:TDG/mug DNA glycosylase family protein
MASVGSPTSSRKPRRKASSSSKPTRSPAATWSSPPSKADAKRPGRADLQAAAGKGLRDVIAPGLKVLFCGINPGLYTAWAGHHFARPGNRFWKALHLGGLTPRQLAPDEEAELLALGLGITNLVERATAGAAELGPEELRAGGSRLAARAAAAEPEVVAVLGVGAYRTAFDRPKAAVGPQPDPIAGSRAWLLPNPSGLNAHYQLPDLAEAFAELRRSLG